MNVGAANGGFPNDPQAISYRPQLLDGSRSLIDWSWLDASLASSGNPVVMGGVCGSDYQGVKPNCFRIPGSTGSNAWYFGQAVLFSSTGTPPAGLTNNQLYFVYPIGSANHYQVGDPTLVSLQPTPMLTAGPEISPTSQGSGTQNFSFRVWHPHWMSWFTLDPSGAENWTDSAAALTHSPYLPQFADQEKFYWEQTGTVIPMLRSQISTATNSYLNGESLNYTPFGRLNVIGGSGPGDRADLGVINEYAARAFLNETPADWANARLFTLGTVNYPFATILNEATGRIPPVNNGPPIGPGGNGVGGSYPALGAPSSTLTVDGNANNWSSVKLPLDGVPNKTVTYLGGQWGTSGYRADHEPSFSSLTYLVFGSPHYRDLLYLHGNRMQYVHTYGNDVQYRDHTLFGTHYWGLFANGCCERRGSFWIFRDTTLAAALGGDSNPERTYFADILNENYNYYRQWLNWKDGSSTNFHTGLFPPNAPGVANDTFIDSYGVSTSYLAYTMLHDPLAGLWLQQWAPFYNNICGEQGKGHISSYYCSQFSYAAALHDAGHLITLNGGVGRYYNGVDGSDFGIFPAYATILAGSGQVTQGKQCAQLTAGDLVKSVSIADWNNLSLGIDQLNEDTRSTILHVHSTSRTRLRPGQSSQVSQEEGNRSPTTRFR